GLVFGTKRLQAAEADAREVAQIQTQVGSIKSLFGSVEREHKQRLQPLTRREESPCNEFVLEAQKIIDQFIGNVSSHCHAILEDAEATEVKLTKVHNAIEEVRSRHAVDVSRLQQENATVTQS